MGVIANKEENLVTVMEVIMRLWISRTSSKKISTPWVPARKKILGLICLTSSQLFYSYHPLLPYNTSQQSHQAIPIHSANTCQKLLLRNNTPHTIDQESALSPDNPQNIAWPSRQCLYNGFIEWKQQSAIKSVVSTQHIIGALWIIIIYRLYN